MLLGSIISLNRVHPLTSNIYYIINNMLNVMAFFPGINIG